MADPDHSAALEAGRLLFAGECQFIMGVAAIDGLPPMGLPEVAFAGRSNVGKSSLINALTGRNALARVSITPGRTQQLNFFVLADRLMLVDMPGHGYAAAAKHEIAAWAALIDAYLKGRATLTRVCLLVDARHGLKDSDEALMKRLDKAAVTYQAVLTKADKLTADALAARHDAVDQALRRHPAAHPELIATSAVSGAGIPALRAALAALAAPA
ncbi:MAG: YihA family ribosome biogenesis GTP-binding protein [Proteobacteria bacterium]|nr:YihA family ribosome biogenesis GTP-binding protein [Pseudomonadota bacterium]